MRARARSSSRKAQSRDDLWDSGLGGGSRSLCNCDCGVFPWYGSSGRPLSSVTPGKVVMEERNQAPYLVKREAQRWVVVPSPMFVSLMIGAFGAGSAFLLYLSRSEEHTSELQSPMY